VAAAAFAAVGGARWQTSVTLAADHLLAIIFLSQHAEGRLDNSASKPQHEMKRRLFLNVVVGQSASILELFSGEDETLLVRRNAFLVLDFRFHVFDAVARLHLQGDRLPGQRLHEDLHDGVVRIVRFKTSSDPVITEGAPST